MKTLRFFEPLPELILAGKKDTTWRINDDKNLQTGDILTLVDRGRREFAKARILWTETTTFGELSPKHTKGHETFESTEEMLAIYSDYYQTVATLATPIKVVKFSLLK